MTAPDPAVVDGVDVDSVTAAVTACATVARMSGGLLGEAATYLPGRRVPGVIVRRRGDDRTELEVRVVATYGPSMAEVAADVRRALALIARGPTIDVVIDDVDGPADGLAEDLSQTAG